MSETITYLDVVETTSKQEADKFLRVLVDHDIDCYMEKRRIVVHPDQWKRATMLIVNNL